MKNIARKPGNYSVSLCDHMLLDATIEHLRQVVDLPDLTGTKYELVRTVAHGGMATVYTAYDRELNRQVALKVLSPPDTATVSAARLLQEARILAKLEHPGIVPVHDAGTLPDGRVFYTMKYVEGTRLDHYLNTALPITDRLRVFERICEAVAFAHARGIIHRDLKPQNIMVGLFGEVLVMDWGIARILSVQDESTIVPATRPTPLASPKTGPPTTNGTILGTPGYMAPEQERGEIDRIDQRTDVYALGGILSLMLTAGAPAPGFSRLKAVARRSMNPEPGGRYQTVQELALEIARYVGGLPVDAYPEGTFEKTRRVVSRYRTPILLVLAYLVMRAVLLIVNGI